MNWQDSINGSFEVVGAICTWANVNRLIKDRIVLGVDWRVFVFFTAWGVWNLYYYPHLGQWFSFVGGLMIVLANAVWLSLVFYFRCIDVQRS